MVPKAVESHPRVDSIRSLIGERMSIKIYEQNMANANRSSTSHRVAAESLNVLIFSDILLYSFVVFRKRMNDIRVFGAYVALDG
jgi:hypothetical protein